MREFELPMSLGLRCLTLDTGHPEDAGGLPGLAVWFWTGCASGQTPWSRPQPTDPGPQWQQLASELQSNAL